MNLYTRIFNRIFILELEYFLKNHEIYFRTKPTREQTKNVARKEKIEKFQMRNLQQKRLKQAVFDGTHEVTYG